jgi:hypothetical protein
LAALLAAGAWAAVGRPGLGLVDAAGPLLLALALRRRLPSRRASDALALDLLAAWPAVTWLAAQIA